MLGDIVPKTTNVSGPKPVPARPAAGGYGAADFGQVATPAPRPVTASSPVPQAVPQPARAAAPGVASKTVSAAKPAGRAPLVLMVVGVLVFISGVSGLFIYALSGS